MLIQPAGWFRTSTQQPDSPDSTTHTNALYSLLDDAPDDGLVIVRNMQSQLMDNKDHS